MPHYDLLIIGAGPVGLSCGIAAKEAGVSYKIIDKGALVNSLASFPADMTFFSSADKLEIGGVPFVSLAVRPSKQEGLAYYRKVAQHYDLHMGLFEAFEAMERQPSGAEAIFRVKTSKTTYTCNYIVNATGFYDTPIPMNVPGEDLPKVRHYFTSAHHLFQQKVAVIGGSNSAIDVALEGYRKGADVTLLIRKEAIGSNVKYWVRPDVEARIKEGNIKVYYEAQVERFTEDAVHFTQHGKSISIENDFVFAMTGYTPNFDLFDQLGIEMDEEAGRPKHNPDTMETTSPNVYLAGVAIGGRNTRKWFIENSKDHGPIILRDVVRKTT